LKVEQTPKVVVQDIVITMSNEEARVLYRLLDTLLWDSLPEEACNLAEVLSTHLDGLPDISWELGNYAGTAKLNT